jgi:hypothetical protein
MAILVVGGHARGIGKTAVMCAVLRAFSGLRWTAVKITAHPHVAVPVFEETDAAGVTDTARYLAAGASRALLARMENHVADRIASESPWLIVESNSVVELIRPDLFLFVVRPGIRDWKESARSLFGRADALVLTGAGEFEPVQMPVFRMTEPGHLSPELGSFIRSRIPGIPEMGVR